MLLQFVKFTTRFDSEWNNPLPIVDVLIIPGGVVSAELDSPIVLEWIAATALQTEITASVCTGAFLLAKAGLLDTKSATTHWEDIDDLKTMFPAVTVRSGVRWIDEGRVVTSAGISAGIDMSLHLVDIFQRIRSHRRCGERATNNAAINLASC